MRFIDSYAMNKKVFGLFLNVYSAICPVCAVQWEDCSTPEVLKH